MLSVSRLEVPERCRRNAQNGDLVEIRWTGEWLPESGEGQPVIYHEYGSLPNMATSLIWLPVAASASR